MIGLEKLENDPFSYRFEESIGNKSYLFTLTFLCSAYFANSLSNKEINMSVCFII